MFKKIFRKKHPNHQGWFDVKSSFFIEGKEEFYIYGNVSKGDLKLGWHLVLHINPIVSIPFEIIDIDEIRFPDKTYTLLKINAHFEEEVSPFTSIKIYNEALSIYDDVKFLD